jgi:cbb3-type cytochrome oxidase subunit 3
MQNVVLLIINSVGVWRYLLSPSRKEAAGRSSKPERSHEQQAPAA